MSSATYRQAAAKLPAGSPLKEILQKRDAADPVIGPCCTYGLCGFSYEAR